FQCPPTSTGLPLKQTSLDGRQCPNGPAHTTTTKTGLFIQTRTNTRSAAAVQFSSRCHPVHFTSHCIVLSCRVFDCASLKVRARQKSRSCVKSDFHLRK